MIVVVPCFERPELLAAALTRIQCARNTRKQRFVFVVDRHANPLVLEVLKGFVLPSVVIKREDHGYVGPRYNILEGYRLALELAVRHDEELIALIEDDVLVSDDVFEFFEDAHELIAGAEPTPCVNACRNQNIAPSMETLLLRGAGPATVYAHKSYQSMAVCHRRGFVAEFLAHARPTYYRDPIGYCVGHLRDDGLPDSAASQDGLIHRVIRGSHRFTIYPTEPRAFHAGWYGYHRRQGRPHEANDWREAAEWILSASADQMNALADPRFRDIARCPMIRHRQALKMV